VTSDAGSDAFIEYAYDIAANALLKGEGDAAFAFLRKLLDADPRHLTLLWRLADAASHQRDYAAARKALEAALAIDPQHFESHIGLAVVLEELGAGAAAQEMWQGDILRGAIRVHPYVGTADPVRVLTIASALHSIRYELFADPATMLNMTLYTQTYDASQPLPEHDVVLVAVADVESDSRALEAASAIVARSAAPIINPPERVLRTSRAEQSRRLAGLDNVVTATVVIVPCEALQGPDRAAFIAAQGLTFPLLVRSPGFHNGRFFELVRDEAELLAAASSMPGTDAMLITYQDTRSADGLMRKFRVMTIDGRLYPVHLAISTNWKVHYVTSDMHRNSAFRDEEAAFLADMSGFIGPEAVRALERIAQSMQLDYAGIDFSVDAAGRVVVFEANAAMAIFLPDADPRWDYRRGPMTRALDAVKRMIVTRASR
jgi:glutathione synthase/RimK-type ligase-like ATP-grasp enzyme